MLLLPNIEPLPPPDNIHLSSVDSKTLTFSWNPVTNNSCHALSYSITSRDCGACPTITHDTFATCVNVPVDDSVCLFQVQTTVCNNNHGPLSSSVPITLTGEVYIPGIKSTNCWISIDNILCTVPVISQVKTVPCFLDKGQNFTVIQVSFNETVGS